MQFTITTTINAPASDIYTAWLDSNGHTKMTGGEAETTSIIGDSFTAWDGYISGKNLELIPNERIKQSWRSTEFNETDQDSILEVLFNEEDGITEITLTHRNLPEGEYHYKKGWEEHYFQPMKIYFS